MSETAEGDARFRPGLFVGLGPLVTVYGVFSYFFFFARYPSFRDEPWLNLLFVLLGVLLSAIGLSGTLRGPYPAVQRAFAAAGLVASLAAAGAFVAYVFWLSAELPPPSATTEALVAAPDFTLPDQLDRPARLAEYRGTKVVLVFYRGYW